MTYTPPLNGGRVNVTIAGNSTSAGAGYTLASTGTVTLAGGNNITLSQNGNAITISGAAGGGGGVALANSQTTYSSGTVNVLEGGGAITIASGAGQSFNFSVPQTSSLSATGQVSISTNGSTISIGAPAQTNQTLSYAMSSQTVGNTSGMSVDARSLTHQGRGIISVGASTSAGGSSLIFSATQSVQPGIASIQASNTTYTSGNVIFGNSNGISFGSAAGSSITASYSQTNQTVGLYGVSNTTVNTSGTADARSISFAGAGGVSVQATNGSVLISGGAGGAGGVALYDGANSISSGTASLADGNGVSLGIAGQTLTASVAAMFNAGMSTSGNTAGTTGTASNQLIFVGGNNVTLSQSTGAGGNTINISAPNFATATSPFQIEFGGNTSGTMSTITTGAVQFAGGNNVTLSQSQQSVTISGATVMPTLSRWEYPEGAFNSLPGGLGQGSLSIDHMYMPFNVTGTAMKIGGSLSAATNTSATTASANVSLWMGIYTLNGSTLSLASSGSANNGFQWSQSASSTANTSINSMRQMTVPMNVNMTPGEYWVGAVISSASTYTSFGYTMFGNSQVTNSASGAVLTPIGSNTTANRDAMLFQGIYTAATAAGPVTISNAAINNTSASNVQRANFYLVIFNATY